MMVFDANLCTKLQDWLNGLRDPPQWATIDGVRYEVRKVEHEPTPYAGDPRAERTYSLGDEWGSFLYLSPRVTWFARRLEDAAPSFPVGSLSSAHLDDLMAFAATVPADTIATANLSDGRRFRVHNQAESADIAVGSTWEFLMEGDGGRVFYAEPFGAASAPAAQEADARASEPSNVYGVMPNPAVPLTDCQIASGWRRLMVTDKDGTECAIIGRVRKDAGAAPGALQPSSFDASQTVAAEIVAERRRQVEAEGWNHASDDRQTDGQLGWAAATYAGLAALQQDETSHYTTLNVIDHSWPFPLSHLRTDDGPRRALVKAGALIVAEIERLDRAGLGR